jgi:ATP-dependent Clp protease adaptor protein ClpS
MGTKTIIQTDVETAAISTELYQLILWNDDVNTFEWVIQSLIDICDYTEIQAEQCAYTVHFAGKCQVRKGSFEKLRPQCEAFIDRGINATIE